MEVFSLNMEVAKNDFFPFIQTKNTDISSTDEKNSMFKDTIEKIKKEENSKKDIKSNSQEYKEIIKEEKEYIQKEEHKNTRKETNNINITGLGLKEKQKKIENNKTKNNIIDKNKKNNSGFNIPGLINLLQLIKREFESINISKEIKNNNNLIETGKKNIQNIKSLILKIEKSDINNTKLLNNVIENIKKEISEIKNILEKIENIKLESKEDKNLKNLKEIIKKIQNNLENNNNKNEFSLNLKTMINRINQPEKIENKIKKDENNKIDLKIEKNEDKKNIIVKDKKVDKKINDNRLNKENKDNEILERNPKNNLDKESIKNEKIRTEDRIETKNYKETVEKIMKQIGENSRGFITKDSAHLTISLKPESLGKIKIVINMKDNLINGRIIVENENVKNILMTEIEKVKQTLASSGINLDNLDVYSQNQDSNRETYQEYLIHKTAAELRKFNNQIENSHIWDIDKNYYPNSNIYIKA
ncbi:MAG TPA: flagellar hook-length control protein FliK [Spirochaetota bacterium]|nr:flagellar hook-length control protein FliK [Spirochaetota bacterium]HOM37993.1 flagellar hook-length control protein FliK [Spirochaetota bacterium]HPQ48797.1 flagellar hook-length control protein FliK [Spirochaetota bacterium]